MEIKQGSLKQFLVLILLLLFFVSLFPGSAICGSKFCRATFINPLTDIRWEGIFPIEIAGVEIKGIGDFYRDPASEGLQTNPEKLGSIICFCKEGNNFRFGLSVSYWEPARIIELTKIPWCFPTLGISLDVGKKGRNLKEAKGGTQIGGSSSSFNAHYYFFNALDILDLFVDLPCGLHEGFDIAEVSEIDPTWNNDLLAFILNPEAILFGNPAAQLACSADSAASLMKYPLDALFWCVGSWGSPYPMGGYDIQGNEINSSALHAAKMIYKNARLGLLWDPGVDVCYAQLTPVWIKSHYKVHMVKPKKGPFVPLGRTSLLWETDKNPPLGTRSHSPDNFSWMMFRRVKCCVGIQLR